MSIVDAKSASAQANSIACPKPTGTAADDVLIAFHTSDWATYAGMTAPSGWELVTGLDRGTNNLHMKVWQKTAGDSEPGSYTFGQSGGPDGCVSIITLRDVDPTGLVFVTPVWQASGSTSRTTPSLSGVPAGSALLCCAMLEAGGVSNTFNPPSGMTELTDVQSTSWNSHSVAALVPASGTTGVRTFTSSTTGYTDGGIGVSVAIPPAATSVAITVDGARAATRATRPQPTQKSAPAVRAARAASRATAPQLAQHQAITVRAARAATAATSPLLVQYVALSVRSARAGTTADVPALGQHQGELAVADARSTTQTSQALLAQSSALGVHDASAAARATRPLLHVPTRVDSARAATQVSSPLLAQSSTLTVDDARSAATAERPTLGQALGELTVQGARAEARASMPVLAQHAGSLDIVSARSASRATSPTPAQRSALVVDEAGATTAADRPILSVVSGIMVGNARVETTASRPLLTVPGVLTVHEARADTTATSPLLAQHHGELSVGDARSESGADRAELDQVHALSVSPARTATTATVPLLVQRVSLAVLSARAEAFAQRALAGIQPGSEVRNPTSVELTVARGLVVVEPRSGAALPQTPLGFVEVAPTNGAALAQAASGSVLHAAEPHTVHAEAEGLVHLAPARGAVLITS